MAKASTLPFSKFLIRVSDGNSPEAFGAPCGLTSRGVNRTATAQDTTTPDCEDEDAPAAVERAVDTLSWSLSGSGVTAKESWRMWLDWFMSGASKKCRVYHFDGDVPDEDLDLNAVGYEEGFFILTTLNQSGQRAQKVTAEIELQSDGAVLWVDAE